MSEARQKAIAAAIGDVISASVYVDVDVKLDPVSELAKLERMFRGVATVDRRLNCEPGELLRRL